MGEEARVPAKRKGFRVLKYSRDGSLEVGSEVWVQMEMKRGFELRKHGRALSYKKNLQTETSLHC